VHEITDRARGSYRAWRRALAPPGQCHAPLVDEPLQRSGGSYWNNSGDHVAMICDRNGPAATNLSEMPTQPVT
jgi:hypothetical protein